MYVSANFDLDRGSQENIEQKERTRKTSEQGSANAADIEKIP